MKIWTPKEGDIYTFNNSVLVGKYNSIVIDKVIGFVKPHQHIYNSRSGDDYDYGLLFSFNLVGISEVLYCKAENFEDFKKAIDPQTAKVESNIDNMTYREVKLAHALNKIATWDIPPDLNYKSDEVRYMREIAKRALAVKL